LTRDSSTGAFNYRPDPAFTDGHVVGFTATRETPQGYAATVIRAHLAGMTRARGFVTGGCVGGDHFVGETLVQIFPHLEHAVIVPAKRTLVHDWWTAYGALVKVIEMPPGTSYRQRDLRLVEKCERLIGYPMYPEADHRSTRSGSWMTIRMARRGHDASPQIFPITRLNRLANRIDS
jgi:hypothetical protein